MSAFEKHINVPYIFGLLVFFFLVGQSTYEVDLCSHDFFFDDLFFFLVGLLSSHSHIVAFLEKLFFSFFSLEFFFHSGDVIFSVEKVGQFFLLALLIKGVYFIILSYLFDVFSLFFRILSILHRLIVIGTQNDIRI